ncbi:hypothetical protein BB779_04090 [Pseudomonas viridiflava]|uniref:STAND family AAA ATPase n=1 Tax=Pseudomonas viridiflava TaxID=33069 RepID=UPI00083FCD5A|nr:hypothetical protein [Pseudomonas viridiflava]ODJ92259.1 hypothetical protein BB779_04090 [Pseudomonas viridiflava]
MQAKIFKCFIASPGDTAPEREICDEVFSKINTTIGQSMNFRVESKRWENDARPSFGVDGQDVINRQLLKEYEIFIGLMWTKFGAPTPRAGSGTEEEFNQAFEAYQKSSNVEIMMYFNTADVPFKAINIEQFGKVGEFKKKVASLGGLYKEYSGAEEFKEILFRNLHDFFSEKMNSKPEKKEPITKEKQDIEETTLKENIKRILEHRLNESLKIFSNQPAIWVEPLLSKKESITEKTKDNYESRVKTNDIVSSPTSTIIKSPPQFGLTCLANYLLLEAWNLGKTWVKINANTAKRDDIRKTVQKETNALGVSNRKIDCIIIDSWKNTDTGSKKLLRNLCHEYKDIPVIVMQTTDDLPFQQEEPSEKINRDFEVLYLLALPRSQVRKVVCGYNDARNVGEENALLEKILRELDALNIHRTPLNCITLLKVSETNLDESPVNRTKMIEMILFALFNLDELPTYKTKPDLKDCEYALGRFCEGLIKSKKQTFTRENFLNDIELFCVEKLLHLEVSVVFDTLYNNNIITKSNHEFCFRATYWIYYFAARRMYASVEFKDYILNNDSYASFPEIIEFYTGIDRDRGEVLEKLTIDLSHASDVVEKKSGLSINLNPLNSVEWNPSFESITEAENSFNENLAGNIVPELIKDEHADRNYNQLKPYDQRIQYILDEYTLSILIQKIKASSRALRNSDYVEPSIKRGLLKQITRGWKQVSLILFALTPRLAMNGQAAFEGQGFTLQGNFGDTEDQKVKSLFLANPNNIVNLFTDDLFSNKIAPLLYDAVGLEVDPLIKHELLLLLIFERPKDWKKHVEEYIYSLPKNSFYLFNTVLALQKTYTYDFATTTELSEIRLLLKTGYAKHQFGKKPSLVEMGKISKHVIPKREFTDE